MKWLNIVIVNFVIVQMFIFFCILGLENKVDFIFKVVEEQIKNNFKNLSEDKEILLENIELDFLGNDFAKLIQEYIFLTEELKYPRKYQKYMGDIKINCFWCGLNPYDNSYIWTEDIIEHWIKIEKPILLGKQVMLQSFELSDLKGRKIIDTIIDTDSGDLLVVLEGGFKLNLNSDIAYLRERVGYGDLGKLTLREVDTILDDPIYAYKKWYNPTEIYEEWHKVFLFVMALNTKKLTMKKMIYCYEKFLDFMEKNICNVMYASPILSKAKYHQILYKKIIELKEFLKGKEEYLISKDILLLLNSRYIYLPHLYNLFEIPMLKNEIIFSKKRWDKKIENLNNPDNRQKGINLEDLAEYFINNINGLKVSGKRVKTLYQEIDLSAVNVSLDKKLWEIGAYILIECKNWNKKVGIKVIRELAHISQLKGNKTTILFSKNGITKDAKKEILRTAINGNYIIDISTEEIKNLKSNEDCYNFLIDKWQTLYQLSEQEAKF